MIVMRRDQLEAGAPVIEEHLAEHPSADSFSAVR